MVTSSHVPFEYEIISGHAPKRCPLCGRVSALPHGEQAASRICPTCGLDFEQLEGLREKSSVRSGAKPSSQANDPIDRWLAGEPMQPPRLSEWQRAMIWVRQHPRALCAMGAVLVVLLSVTLGSLYAYYHAANELRLVSTERDVASTERLGLATAVAQKSEEIQAQESRLQEQQREQQELEQNLNRLRANYQQSQQQCQAADQRVKDAVRAARYSIAEDMSRQAE